MNNYTNPSDIHGAVFRHLCDICFTPGFILHLDLIVNEFA